ncbi:hypothetical protein, partial [Bacillus paralicheniformis]|uniref:hypothetical protein n=1 Tax=Bacillus paralicheniformis TaxID=1648923 RepID=UPI002DB8BEFC
NSNALAVGSAFPLLRRESFFYSSYNFLFLFPAKQTGKFISDSKFLSLKVFRKRESFWCDKFLPFIIFSASRPYLKPSI